jgi:hypothetical protein
MGDPVLAANAETHGSLENVKNLVLVAVDVQRRRLAEGHPLLDHADAIDARAAGELDVDECALEPEKLRRWGGPGMNGHIDPFQTRLRMAFDLVSDRISSSARGARTLLRS